MGRELHVASLEVVIFKVHGIPLLGELIDLAEAVHVELPHERGHALVAEEMRKHPLLHLLHVLYVDLAVLVPAQVVRVLWLLHAPIHTSRM